MTINDIMVGQVEERLINCGILRVKACVERLSDDQLQWRPNEHSNSINNQILHLDGNVRQWLLATLTASSDQRKRDNEFDYQNQKSKEELLDLLDALERDVRSSFPIIRKLDLAESRHVQCYHETILSILVHVIEHYSYHLGQITYITKMLLDIDTGYYADMELNKVN